MKHARCAEPPYQRQEGPIALSSSMSTCGRMTRSRPAMLPTRSPRPISQSPSSRRPSAARRATRDLSGRLKELQQRLHNAEEALATYKAQNNFVGSQDNLLTDQQLSLGNQRLAAARAPTLDAQASVRPDRGQPTRIDGPGRNPGSIAVTDHGQSARAICRGEETAGRAARRPRPAASAIPSGHAAGRRPGALDQGRDRPLCAGRKE